MKLWLQVPKNTSLKEPAIQVILATTLAELVGAAPKTSCGDRDHNPTGAHQGAHISRKPGRVSSWVSTRTYHLARYASGFAQISR